MKYIIDQNTGYQGNIISSITVEPYVDYSGALYNDNKSNLTFEEYKKIPEHIHKGLIAIEWEELEPMIKKWEIEMYTGKEPVQIGAEAYNDALECLPPENWVLANQFQHFRMMEYTTGSITVQYATKDGVYISKSIDARDQSTWIKVEDFEGLEPLEN